MELQKTFLVYFMAVPLASHLVLLLINDLAKMTIISNAKDLMTKKKVL